jgi:hypothetical protein
MNVATAVPSVDAASGGVDASLEILHRGDDAWNSAAVWWRRVRGENGGRELGEVLLEIVVFLGFFWSIHAQRGT